MPLYVVLDLALANLAMMGTRTLASAHITQWVEFPSVPDDVVIVNMMIFEKRDVDLRQT
jgi:hypothetical protein